MAHACASCSIPHKVIVGGIPLGVFSVVGIATSVHLAAQCFDVDVSMYDLLHSTPIRAELRISPSSEAPMSLKAWFN